MSNINFISLEVSDLASSTEFYSDILGFATDNKIHQPDAVVFQNSNGAGFAIKKEAKTMRAQQTGEGVAIWFEVDDIEKVKQKVFKKTGQKSKIIPTPFGDKIEVIDPNGYKLTLYQPNGDIKNG